VLGANRELAGAEVELVDLERRDQRLKLALEAADKDFDFVLIDCPPSLSMLTLNGLCAAHGVIVPMQCEYFALEGLTDLVNTIKQVHANMNPDLKIIGLLRVMFDPRITLQQQVSEQLKSHFGDKVFDTVIPRNVGKAYEIQPGDASRAGVTYEVANGEEIRNLCEKLMPVVTAESTWRGMRAQVADVSKALQSVRTFVKAGHMVVFGDGDDGDGNYIVNKITGEFTSVKDDGTN
jgi:cellulose biosynthesis protein BcsQ